MYAVEKLSGFITRGVYTVSGPFHPFGGAVDIIVVQQQDGSYKSSPWYVRFGKFQGLLKTKEKIVTICVNGEEAKFHMYLDHKGEAYFLKECDSNESGDVENFSPSSEDEIEVHDRNLRFKKVENCNYDEKEQTVAKENDNEKTVTRTRSKGGILLGLMFGNTQTSGDGKNTDIDRTSSLERAEIAATLLETKWSTNISSIQSATYNDLKHCLGGNDSAEESNDSQCVKVNDNIDLVTNLHHVEDTSQLILATNEQVKVLVSENFKGNLDAVQENYDDEEVKSIIYSETSETSETSTICTEKSTCIEGKTNNLEPCCSEIISKTQDSLRHSSRNTSIVVSPGMYGSCAHETTFQDQETTEFSQKFKTAVVDSENEDDVQFPFTYLHSNANEVEAVDAMPTLLNGDESKEQGSEIILTSASHTSPMNIPKITTIWGETDKLLTKSVPIIRSQIHDLDRSNPLHTLSFSLKHNTDKSGSISSCLSLDATSLIDDSPIDSCDELNERKQQTGDHELISISQYSMELNDSSNALASNDRSWRLWPFGLKRSVTINTVHSESESTAEGKNVNSPMRSQSMTIHNDLKMGKPTKKKMKLLAPDSEDLASLNLTEGVNVITFSFSTSMLGQQQVDARIYLWKWNTRIVISDVDGTITKSDVLGQFMPLVGKDWSHTGVAHLFSAIKENEYQFLFLSARAVSQASLTRQFLFNLRQDGKALPDGPVVISPDGLFPSLYREVIRRAPHEFKIACLEDIKALFPPECNPFYAGFGNRYTDELSYLKVGIPKGKIFIINPKGEVVVNRRVDSGSYKSLRALVYGMFPPATTEVEDYNRWNFWKLPPPNISI